jgi:hypothetical protein
MPSSRSESALRCSKREVPATKAKEGTMPTWLVPTLKWGGIALAVIAAIAIIYVQFIAAPAPPDATAATDEAPMTLYWILLLVGVVGRVARLVEIG